MKEVAEKTYRLEVPIPGLVSAFAIYLIQESRGIIIEPGPAVAVPHIRESMKKLGMKDLAYIIPTHMHIDHAGGIGTLARLFPEAKVLVHPKAVKHAVNPSRLIESIKMVWGTNFEVSLGPILPVSETQVMAVEDGEIISIDGRELQILYAPGHAPHQIVIFDRTSRGIFCGDALGMLAQSSRPFPLPNTAPPNFDEKLYLETAEKLRLLQPRTLFYSHGGVEQKPDELISILVENTHTLGKLIQKAHEEGKTLEEIVSQVKQHITQRFGIEVSEKDLAMTVGGYMYLFANKGSE